MHQQVCYRLHWPLSGSWSQWGPTFSLPWHGSKVLEMPPCSVFSLHFSGRHDNWPRVAQDNCWSSSSSLWGAEWDISAAVSALLEGFLSCVLLRDKKCLPREKSSLSPRAALWHRTTGSPRLLVLLPSASRAFPESTWTWEGRWRAAPLMQLWWLDTAHAKAGNDWLSEAPQGRAIEPTGMLVLQLIHCPVVYPRARPSQDLSEKHDAVAAWTLVQRSPELKASQTMTWLDLSFNAQLNLEGEIRAKGGITEGVKILITFRDQVLSNLFLSICRIKMNVLVFQMRKWILRGYLVRA